MKLRGEVLCHNTKTIPTYGGGSTVTSAEHSYLPGSIALVCKPDKQGRERCTLAFTDCDGGHEAHPDVPTGLPSRPATARRVSVKALRDAHVVRGRSNDGKWYTRIEWRGLDRPYEGREEASVQVWDDGDEAFVAGRMFERPYPRADLKLTHKSTIMRIDAKNVSAFRAFAQAIAAASGMTRGSSEDPKDLPPIPAAMRATRGRR